MMLPSGATASRLDANFSPDFASALHDGLSQAQKSIPSRFFYDARGSALFEAITQLDEYYPTRTEIGILEKHAAGIAADAGPDCLLVEFGSGASRKTELLLDKMLRPAGYVPIDISPAALEEAAQRLRERYPGLRVHPLIADFSAEIALPEHLGSSRQMGFFPGSTIGNLHPADVVQLLERFRTTLGNRSLLVVGVDLQKDARRLHAAYNDGSGVTAAFNLNLLLRANREAAANFDLESFRHEATYNAVHNRIEMHLVSVREQHIVVAEKRYRFGKGETIHTENSYKYTLDGYEALAAQAGWTTLRAFTDHERLFSVHVHAATP